MALGPGVETLGVSLFSLFSIIPSSNIAQSAGMLFEHGERTVSRLFLVQELTWVRLEVLRLGVIECSATGSII